MPDITPTAAGQDLTSTDGKRDAHIRIEEQEYVPGTKGTMICVDVFDSSVFDPNEAHMDSFCTPWGNLGAGEMTDFLKGYGFNVTVRFG
jgi:hypothetical protein